MNTATTTTAVESVLDIIRTAILSVVSAESWDASAVETIHLAATGCPDARLVDDENREQLEAHVEDAMRAALTVAGYPAVDTAFISHYVARPRKHDEECAVEGCVVCRALTSGPVLVNNLNFPGQRCSFAELMDAARTALSEAEVKGLLNQTAANATMVTAFLADAVAVFTGPAASAAAQTAESMDDDF
ncbi:hypothetical protein ASH00_15875 [Arthrobacter sp. Soil782]|uniref:hypothetical protein n=1 Tax=Arthrobacter sp. Soil782 TaxID=1736410 RepID=UPI0007015AA8|nr:hypothetical protein [Arthrobacter sp. Soil782]KRF03263.1 hypothetical protein ASH00_15875 [Arthrobacter sp. Soil782]